MSFDVSKLTSAEALKALQDGKITAEELKGFTEAEQAELANALGGVKLEAGDVFNVKTGKVEKTDKPENPEKQEGWLKRTWKNASPLGKVGMVAAGAAAAVLAGAVGYGAVIGLGKLMALGTAGKVAAFGIMGTGGFAIASCKDKERGCHEEIDENGNKYWYDKYGVKYATEGGCLDEEGEIVQGSTFPTTVINNVTVNIPLDALTTAMQNWMQQHHDDMQAILAAIKANGATLQNVQNLMTQYGMKLDLIIELLMAEGAKLTDITALLRQMSGQLGDITNLLNKIDRKAATITNQNSAEYKLLQRILAEIGRFRDDANNDHAKIIALLEKLVDRVGSLEDAVATGFADVVVKLGDMDYKAQKAFAEILDKLDIANGGLQNVTANQMTQIQKLADILAAIQAGNVTMENGNATLIEIKNLIQGLNLGTEVNLETIETLLAQILEKETANGNMLNNIYNNTALIHASVNALKAEVDNLKNTVTNFSQQNHDDLMAILDAIGRINLQTCNCDCERIIELLEEIAQRLGDGDYNHEGYRDDYSDIFG